MVEIVSVFRQGEYIVFVVVSTIIERKKALVSLGFAVFIGGH